MQSNPRIKANIERTQRKLKNHENQGNPDQEEEGRPTALLAGNPDQEEEGRPTALLATAFQATQSGSEWTLYNSFILDSGATTHICHTRSRFFDFKPAQDQLITAGSPLLIHGYGNVNITVQSPKGPKQVILLNTAYIPDCSTNMVSCHKVLKAGVTWDQLNHRLVQNNKTFCTLTQVNHLSVVEFNQTTSHQAALISKRFTKSTQPKPAQEVSIQTLHRRFAHAGLEAIAKLPSHSAGIRLSNPKERFHNCEVCRQSKAKRIIIRVPVKAPTQPYEVVSCDLIEFKKVNQDAGYGRYVIHFYCRYTGMNHVYTLPLKNEEYLFNTVRQFCAYTQTRWNLPVRVIQTDGETGLGNTTKAWLAAQGISLNPSPPDTPDQNGAAERSGGVVITTARALQIDSNIPGYMWPEAISAAGYLLNRTPRQKYSWKTPLERLQAYKSIRDPEPQIGHIRIFGCRAYPLTHHIPKTAKLEPRAAIGYLVGWDSTNIFRIWVPTLQKVIRTRDVTFDETTMYNPHREEVILPANIIYTLELPTLADTNTADQIANPPEEEAFDISFSNQSPPLYSKSKDRQSDSNSAGENLENPGLITPEFTPTPGTTPPPEPEQRASLSPSEPPLDGASPNLSESTLYSTSPLLQSNLEALINPETNTVVDDQPQSQRVTRDRSQGVDPSNIIREPRTRKPTARKEAYIAALDSVDQLVGYHNAFLAGTQFNIKQRPHRSDLPPAPVNWAKLELHLHSEGFKNAAQKEFYDLEAQGTWELVDQSNATSRPLPLKWVFTYKYDTDGYLDRYKGRICVRGDLQPYNDRDNYAATLASKVFRALMAIAARFDLEIVQMDAITAFINSLLDEEVYTYLPDGFRIPGKVLRLKRALYGLRRSPLLWLQEFTSTLLELGLKPVPEAQCLFTNNRITVFFYVDDVVILYHKTHQKEFELFKQALLNAYRFKDLGELKWFLGIRVVRDRPAKRLWLCQDSYIEKIATSFNLTDAAQSKTPLLQEELFINTEEATAQEVHAYQSRIGSTTYATTITRPDAARASNKLAEFLRNPSPAHLKAANQLIKYLYDTRYLAIEYNADSILNEPEFRCSTDAAFGDNVDNRKSTEGYIFKLFGGPIDWKSTKQKLVTRSSTEAELVALSHASTEIYWWRRFFTQIQLDLKEYQVECDNQQTIRLLTTPAIKLATKLKHIDIHHHWLRQEVQEQRLQLKWIPTNSMPADGFTKALPTQKHLAFIKQLGLVDIRHLIQA
jgi:hypothetical protein